MKRNIVLIGSMGSGKSHLGRNLAEARGWQFVDTDRVLEQRYQLPIADIFNKLGERAFRTAELEVLKRVCMYHEAVISVGGNFPIEMKTLRFLQKYSYIVGIRAAEYRIVRRVNRKIGKRPTMDYNDVQGFVASMMRCWRPVYKKCDFVLDTTHGHTMSLVDEVEEQLTKEAVAFKARKQPKLQLKQPQSQRKQPKAPLKGGHAYEANSRINQRRRCAGDERSRTSRRSQRNI